MGEIISGRTHLLDGKIKHQKVVVIKPNYFTQELGLTTCSGHKVTKGIDSNYLEVIKASDFFSKIDSTRRSATPHKLGVSVQRPEWWRSVPCRLGNTNHPSVSFY